MDDGHLQAELNFCFAEVLFNLTTYSGSCVAQLPKNVFKSKSTTAELFLLAIALICLHTRKRRHQIEDRLYFVQFMHISIHCSQ